MGYNHITQIERECIENLHQLGYSCREIAKQLRRHHSSIARELARNKSGTYESASAQDKYKNRRQASRPKGKLTAEIAKLIEEKLQQNWSPEKIAKVAMQGQVSFKTIYNWIAQNKIKCNKMLCSKKRTIKITNSKKKAKKSYTKTEQVQNRTRVIYS